MKVKRYVVNNMNEAMNMIRYEMGKDAVIISQRKIKKPGILGLFSKKSIEVTAAVDNVKIYEEPLIKDNQELLKEMQEMKNVLNEMKEVSSCIKNATESKTTRKKKIQIKLENSDLSENIIKDILIEAKNSNDKLTEEERVKKAVKKRVSISTDKLEGTVILVGPTGVGKTTTIAKLAGRLSLVDKKKVGLITIDTYRIGAVEQLKTYADIMNLPFKVVMSLKDMEASIESMKDCDVVLIDTTGRNSKNTIQISELRAFIEKTNYTSVHLVISSTTKEKDISMITEGFRELNYNNVIITKLDETSTFGSILNILHYAKKPLSYVATGQNVPDDLSMTSKEQICNLILGEGKL